MYVMFIIVPLKPVIVLLIPFIIPRPVVQFGGREDLSCQTARSVRQQNLLGRAEAATA